MTDLRGELKKKITDVVMTLMDIYDTAPEYTFDALIDEFPDLCEHFMNDDILAMCEEVQRSEVPEGSARLQPIFERFNERYFNGRLQGYKIRVVYDIRYWVEEENYEVEEEIIASAPSNHPNRVRKIIYLRRGVFPLEYRLIEGMANAVTADGNYAEWTNELRRVSELGAPVWRGWLTGEACPIPQPLTREQIFGE